MDRHEGVAQMLDKEIAQPEAAAAEPVPVPAPEPVLEPNAVTVGPRSRPTSFKAIAAAAILSATVASGMTVGAVAVSGRLTPSAPTSPAAAGTTANLVVSSTASDTASIVAQAEKSVVTITSTSAGGGTSTGVGSGFVVSSNGLILTNAHVVSGAQSLTVDLPDGRQLPATVVTADSAADLALIRVSATGLTAATLGDSSAVQVGQAVFAIGTPLGEYADTV